MNWAMEKSILAAYTPPLRNKVRKPAGFPTPFGWAYPVLFCAVFECGRKPSAVRRVSGANLEVERFGEKSTVYSFRKISRLEHRSSSKSWFGAETGEGACGPLPLAPNPKGTTPQSAAADSSPYTGEPKNNPSGAARQLPLRGAFESVRPASGGRRERGCRGSDSSPAGNAPRRGKMMCGFCAVAASPQSAAAANGEETGGRCGVRRPRSGWRSCVSACRISRPEHRSGLKSRFGAELQNKLCGTSEPSERRFRCEDGG